MKKLSFILILCFISGLLLIPIHAAADFESFAHIDDKTSVYGAPGEQDFIYELLQQESEVSSRLQADELEIVKESIVPVYYVNLVEYAQTGEFTMHLLWSNSGNGAQSVLGERGNTYSAKMVLADGSYAGIMQFTVENGTLLRRTMSLGYPLIVDDIKCNVGASCSYEEHAERIRELLNKEAPIPAENVRYVIVEGDGEYFYVDDGGRQVLVSVGHYEYTSKNTLVGGGVYDIATDVKARADEMLARKEEWEAENPGGTWDVIGGLISTPEIDNVNNASGVWLYIGIAAGIVVVAAAITVIIVTKKRKTKPAQI